MGQNLQALRRRFRGPRGAGAAGGVVQRQAQLLDGGVTPACRGVETGQIVDLVAVQLGFTKEVAHDLDRLKAQRLSLRRVALARSVVRVVLDGVFETIAGDHVRQRALAQPGEAVRRAQIGFRAALDGRNQRGVNSAGLGQHVGPVAVAPNGIHPWIILGLVGHGIRRVVARRRCEQSHSLALPGRHVGHMVLGGPPVDRADCVTLGGAKAR
jgi:hypothetical protein